MFSEKSHKELIAFGFIGGLDHNCYILYEMGKRRVKASVLQEKPGEKIVMTIYNGHKKPRTFHLPENSITEDLLKAFI